MKKAKFEVSGEILSVTEVMGGKVDILLATETDRLIHVYLKRKNCNPHRWNVSDYIKVVGDVVTIEDSSDGALSKIEFSNAVLKRLFSIGAQNKSIDYCSPISLCGEIVDVLPIDSENYELTLVSDDGIYIIECDNYTLFNNIVKLDMSKKFRINGVIYITKHSQYSSDGHVISRINFVATTVETV